MLAFVALAVVGVIAEARLAEIILSRNQGVVDASASEEESGSR